ncbi:MAG: MFS transporter [Candidatus Binatia bacterium]
MTLRRKLGWLAVLYFAEGMPFGVVHELLPLYFKVHGVSLAAIGLMSLVGLPWIFKPLWSPLIDRFGERRFWICACLAALAVQSAAVPLFDPAVPGLALWALMLGMAFASATQDIAIDAYAIGIVDPGQEGDANGVRLTAARLALIASGGGLVLLASQYGWEAAFVTAAVVFALLAVLSTAAPRVAVPAAERRRWLAAISHWLQRPGVWAVFGLALTYKLGDAAMGRMIKPFWIDRGLSLAEIGIVSSTVGMFATIAGAIVGGRLTARWGILRALFILGLAQALSNLGYATVAFLDPPPPQTVVTSFADLWSAAAEPARLMIYASSLLESFTSGLGTAAFLAFLMHVCDKQHAAVQYAVLSALFALARDGAGAVSGFATSSFGYGPWFAFTVVLAVPGLCLIPAVRGWVHDRETADG